MCIYVHFYPTVSVEGLAVWFPDRPGSEEIKWNRKKVTPASFSTHTCTALLSPEGNTHLHTFFDLLSLNLDVWFSFRLWGFLAFWQSFSFRQTDGAWSHERAVQMLGGSVGQTRSCGWQAALTDKSNKCPFTLGVQMDSFHKREKHQSTNKNLKQLKWNQEVKSRTINQSRMLN